LSVETEKQGCQDIAEKSQVVLIKVSAQEIQSVLERHPGEERDDIETNVLGADSEIVECSDEVLGVLHIVREFTDA
jgi:hypothetical protein